jgi:uncharacterized RDD family membrane protein YckC
MKTSIKIKRLIAAYLDLMLSGLIAIVIHLIEVGLLGESNSHSSFPFWVSVFSFLLKDSIWHEGSIGKKIIGIKLVRIQNGIKERFLNFCRNLPSLLSPLEILIMIFNPNGKRLGDLIFGGEFVETSSLLSEVFSTKNKQ